jgi:membrane associated rhomboid family serine protease
VIPLRDDNPTRRRPIVTIALIAACVAVFAYELVVQSTGGDPALERLFRASGLVPSHLTDALNGGSRGDVPGTIASIFSSMFLHGGWIHLIGNMLYLWIFGNNIEDRFGRVPFLAFYLFGGVVAAVSQVLISPDSRQPVVGASGAIAAVLGAYVVLFPRARVLSLVFLGFFYQLLRVPAILVLGFWFVLQLIDGVASLGVASSSGGVAIFAHIGGFLAGVAVGVVVRTLGSGPGRRLSSGSPVGFGVG